MQTADEIPLSETESRLLETGRAFSRRELGLHAARRERERSDPRHGRFGHLAALSGHYERFTLKNQFNLLCL